MKLQTSSVNQLSASPSLITKQVGGKISSVGGVAKMQSAGVFGTPIPPMVSFTLDNSGGATPKSYLLFDSLGLIAAELSGSFEAPTSTSAGTHAALKEAIKTRPMTFKGLNYRIVTGNPGQFSEAFQIAKANIAGAFMKAPIFPQTAIRNTQQNDKVLTLDWEALVDQETGIRVDVAANTSIVLEFFTDTVMNTF